VGTALTSSLLKRWAVEEGFDRAGVARLAPSDHADAFRAWIARGDHAGMAYLEGREDERLDPRNLLEGAESVLCVALQYHPPEEPVDESSWGRVARYARGRDYHDLMWERLDRLAARVEEVFPEVGTRRYVDTGPVLERELAARAGIGSFGKNTNLLHPEAGSWFFLGELFLTAQLAPDVAVAELCGTCSRCLDECPTGALPAPYRLDAGRCISYWTIEHRGWLPEEARSLVGEWLFGCDVCQEVCPLNEGPLPTADAELAPHPERSALSLEALLELSREEYVELFRGSPMKRAKLEGLQRNAAVVLGNSRRREAAPALSGALRHPEATVRGHAAWALGELGQAAGDEGREALRTALAGERDARVRGEMETALERLSGA
jgi:epoxyqueuosine reductase